MFFVLVSHMQPSVAVDLIWDKKSQRKKKRKKERKKVNYAILWREVGWYFWHFLRKTLAMIRYNLEWAIFKIPTLEKSKKVSRIIWITPNMGLGHRQIIVSNLRCPLRVPHPTLVDISLKEALSKSFSIQHTKQTTNLWLFVERYL